MIVRNSRVATTGMLLMIFGVTQSSRNSLRGNQRQLDGDEATAVSGIIDFSGIEGFSDIGVKNIEELDFDYDGTAPFVLELPEEVWGVVNDTVKDGEADARIIGGQSADGSNYIVPNNQVMLLRQTGTTSSGEPIYAPNNCAGTLITNCHVLTAAHCIGRYGANNGVLVNARNVDSNANGGAPRWKSPISGEWAHPSYQAGAKPYDIGIITLQHCVPENMLGQLPPCRVASNLPSDNSATVVAGFGRTDPNISTKPRTMQAVQVIKISDSSCKSAYGSAIDSTQFCAGEMSGGKDSCQGDSGGGIYAGTDPDTQTLIGTVSWGFGCAQAGKPGVYANVPYFKSWIASQVCNDYRVATNSCPICGGSYAGSNSGTTRTIVGDSTGGSQPDCSWSSSRTVTFTDSNNQQKTLLCRYMSSLISPVNGIDYKQYCSISKVASKCEFACHSSCPYI